MTNLEHYIEDNSKKLVTNIESMLASVARRVQELDGDIDDMYFGGVEEVPEALKNPADSFDESEQLYSKLIDTNNDIDHSDYIIDEDGDGDSYRYFNRF